MEYVRTLNQHLAAMAAAFLAITLMSGCANKVKGVPLPASALSMTNAEIVEEEKLVNLSLEELRTKGDKALDEGNVKLARLYFTRALANHPDTEETLTGFGEVLRREGKPETAAPLFAEALKIKKDYRPALLGAGHAARDLAQYPLAIQYFGKALANDPSDLQALNDLALTYDLLQKLDLAEPLYRQIVEIKPNDVQALNNLGFNYILQGKYRVAIETLEQALNLSVKNNLVRNNLASAYILSGKEHKALNLFKKTVGKAGAYNNLGYFYLMQKDFEKAEKAFKRALDLNPVFYVKAMENLNQVRNLKREAETKNP